MSLLLDALKKTGSAKEIQGGGIMSSDQASELSLEEITNKPASAAAPSPGIPSHRNSGENLFAAKKAPVQNKFHYNLGIVPTALILGLLLGTAGGIYVWIEIQPPKAIPYRQAAVPAESRIAPASRTAPPLALPPETLPETPPPKIAQHAIDKNISQRRKAQAVATAQAPSGIQIERQFENDAIYNRLSEAYQAYRNGDLNTAARLYREVLHRDTSNRDALLGMAAISQQQAQDDAAIHYYKQVIALDPRDPVAIAGLSAFSTVDAAHKESRLKLSLSQNPQSAALHFALGNLYSEELRWGDAQLAYFNALKLEPTSPQFSFNLATSLDHLGQSKLAAQYYTQALTLDTTGKSGFDRVQTQQRLNQLLAH